MGSRRTRLLAVASGIATIGICFALGSLPVSTTSWATIYTWFVLAGIPALALVFTRTRGRTAESRRRSRVTMYCSTVIFELAIALAAVDLLLETRDFDWNGFRALSPYVFVAWFVILFGGLVALNRTSHYLRGKRGFRSFDNPAQRLIPQSRADKIVCLAVFSPLVGICEEVIYRGFLFNELPGWFHSHSLMWTWIISSVAFGLAHIEKNLRRAAGAIVVGFWLALPVVLSGSIYPSMAAHAAYDGLVLSVLLPRDISRAIANNAEPAG